MIQPTLHYTIGSSSVIAGFINDSPGFELPMVSLPDTTRVAIVPYAICHVRTRRVTTSRGDVASSETPARVRRARARDDDAGGWGARRRRGRVRLVRLAMLRSEQRQRPRFASGSTERGRPFEVPHRSAAREERGIFVWCLMGCAHGGPVFGSACVPMPVLCSVRTDGGDEAA